jgi:RecG-like helicase
MDDLKKLFEEVKAKNDKTKRLVRSEKEAEEEAKKNAAIDAVMAEEAKVEEVVDPLEFAPIKDVLSQFDGEWQDATAALKKWDEKKAKLDEIAAACNNVKIKPVNTENIAKFLLKEVNNTNVNISMAAIGASTAIANGMKKDFEVGSKILLAGIL